MNASSTESFAARADSPSAVGLLGAAWGIGGVMMLLGHAVVRLAPRALESIGGNMSAVHWAALIASVVLLAYTEGYKAFHLGFSPRVVVRASHLAQRPVWWHVLLAPLFCMGFFHATRKRRIVTVIVTSGVVGIILLVRLVPMPWRGFIDAGVVVALSWGVLSILWYAARVMMGQPPAISPDLPGS